MQGRRLELLHTLGEFVLPTFRERALARLKDS